MSQNPWWHPSDDDPGWDEPLPVIIRLAPDYSAPLPLWGEGFGDIDWRYTKFPPALDAGARGTYGARPAPAAGA